MTNLARVLIRPPLARPSLRAIASFFPSGRWLRVGAESRYDAISWISALLVAAWVTHDITTRRPAPPDRARGRGSLPAVHGFWSADWPLPGPVGARQPRRGPGRAAVIR